MCASRSLRAFGLCLLLVSVIESAQECDKSQCKGTLGIYEELKCKPVYEKESDCCAFRYDCSHLNERSVDKCYANGHEYAIREELRDEDRTSGCDRCTCLKHLNTGEVAFNCAAVDCFEVIPKPGCYVRQGHDSCCLGEEVCPEKGKSRPICVVDGETYLDGDQFTVKDDPSLSCYCMEGYKGENVAPFCRKVPGFIELRHGHELRKNCVPFFENFQEARILHRHHRYQCPYDDDVIIYANRQSTKLSAKEVSEEMMCKFGNLTMRIGDELKRANKWRTWCMKCTCEVPPLPTCVSLADEKCGNRF